MRYVSAIFCTTLTLLYLWALHTKHGSLPPLGKLLNPIDGFWANAAPIPFPATLPIEGLQKPVEIHWDDAHIPHIIAQTDWDLYAAQGYITAYHRLWQMEFQITKTAGRLSEIIGEATLEIDRLQRRRGIAYAAERMEEAVRKNPASYQVLAGYAHGVNAFIQSLDYQTYPLEYKLLDYAPESWSVYKSCLLMKEMADILSTDNRDIENSHLRQQLGDEQFALLFDEVLLDPIIPVGSQLDIPPLPPEQLLPLPDSLPLPYPIFENTYENTHGSNQVVIGPTLSASGNVLMSNEPDLDLNLPSLWYLVHLVQPQTTLNTMGGSLPGLPGIVIGFNDSIAWGITNANRDLVDWYAIDFVNESRKEYLYDNQYYKTEKRIEKIIVRDGTTLYDTVVYTHYGPVVYDANFGYNNQSTHANLAMHWTGALPSDDWYAIYLLNRSQNYTDFKQAIPFLQSPPQNICVGTAAGDIAWWAQGKYPIKRQEQGKFVQNGTQSSHEWLGYIPQEHALYRENPPEGFLSSANEAPVANADYPYHVYWYNFSKYRGRRLRERLETMRHIHAEDLIDLQNDNFNLVAYELLPLLLDSVSKNNLSLEQSKIYESLQNWNFFNDASSVGAIYFEIWFEKLNALIWDEAIQWQSPKYLPSVYKTSTLIRTQPNDFALYDRQNTPTTQEQLSDLIVQSFESIPPAIDKWKKTHAKQALTWSNFKGTAIRHLLRKDEFSVLNVNVGGRKDAVNAIKKNHGPSLRLVVELSKEKVSAWAIYPGSQTGHVGHPNYAEWVKKWAKQDYLLLLFDEPAVIAQKATFSHKFLPN